jgi:putative methyltransferase (TIGR04325 family)
MALAVQELLIIKMPPLTLRYFVKQITPPLFFNVIRLALLKVKGCISFDYKFSSWEAAEKATSGYDNEVIIEKVATSARLVSSGKAVYERDSVIFNEIQYSWPLLAGLLLAATWASKLRVVDFGGSLGTTFRQNRKFIGCLPFECQWRVVEQEKFVEIGTREFTTKNLSFYLSIMDARLDGVDVVLFGGSICYVSEPYKYISQAVEIDAEFIVFDRTPMTTKAYDTFAVQHIPADIYKASFPVRSFNYDNLYRVIESKYELVEKWICDLQVDPQSTAMGFIFKRRPVGGHPKQLSV